MAHAEFTVNDVRDLVQLSDLKTHDNRATEIKERFDWVMLNRATESELLSISKAIDYSKVRDRLNQKFGIPKL